MSSNHLFYIPTILLIGIFLGFTLASYRNQPSSKDNQSSYQFKFSSLASAFAIFFMTLILTHALPIPGGVKSLHASLGHQQLFDQRPSFSQDEVYQRIESFGEAGRESYRLFTYTSDFFFPLSLLLFLFVLSKFVEERVNICKTASNVLKMLPFLWFAFDMLENMTIFSVLSIYPSKMSFLANVLAYLTVGKFLLLLAAFALPIVGYISLQKSGPNRETHKLPSGHAK